MVDQRKLSRRSLLKASALGLSSLLAGCVPPVSTTQTSTTPEDAPQVEPETAAAAPAASTPREVIFWHNTGEAPIQARLDRLAAKFHEEHPDITAKCEYMGTGREFLEKLITSLAGGIPPDLSFGYPYWATQFVEDGASVVLDDYFAADSVFKKEDLQDATWPSATWKGQIVAMPQTYHPYVLYYNTAAFEEVGVDVPKNWDEFLNVCTALTRDTDGDGKMDRWAIDFYFDDARRWMCFVRNNGGTYMDQSGTEFTWNTPEALEALELWDKIFNEVKAVPLGDVDQGFEMGFIGMTTAGPWRIEGYLDAKTPFGVAVFPWRKRPLTEANVDMVIMYKTDDAQQQAAWDFLTTYVGPEYQRQVAIEGYYFPLHKSIETDPDYLKWLDTVPVMQQLLGLEGEWTTMENTKKGEEPLDILNRELELALRGEKGLQEALDTATAEANALIA